ncbi:MAG TPA: hypothetical protein DEF39_01745 [Hungateiclostridium thermocellum]|nr:hypothetical protein Clo1313_0611 [Acetivibrio thermocellus DSM 1313]ALX07621.1 hypothetical protein AD2_00619 [Acetivibrio thermocellus AD2]ANV75363.1 hypothetical protein LQRI_0618 [Acetivibrio thermocellus DSM 2360]EIC03552.1 hypothetical protein YSBL_2772 [Acetivibrio thermocellus YS]THJ76453.1 hypothetical protein EPD62_16550 [Acetivibrio thermocellus]CDG37538.1 hypothetical protein CTHBC1_2967 [Acetivibrio thermocellus BC1]
MYVQEQIWLGEFIAKSFFIILRIFLLLIVIFLIIEFISKLKDKKARVNSDKFVPENPEVLWECPECSNNNPNTTFTCNQC